MNKLIGAIIVVSALIGAATAWRFPFSLGPNRATNQLQASPEAAAEAPVGQTQVQPANQPNQPTVQVQRNNQPNRRIAQAPQTVGQAGTGTTQPAPPPANEAAPVPALW
ncbi:MAG TPA: hypothetical protein DDZ80_16730 [Cyanobacteria bacterium UBA8803]|nr:hypothetical protein [Cyanobacteria bacterium UBA9273]HBL60048.1 hypothetical protein [Cyanobacteria bacterium UBA8803]